MKVKICADSCNNADDCMKKYANILEYYKPDIIYSHLSEEYELMVEIDTLKALSYLIYIIDSEIIIESDFEEEMFTLTILDN